MGNVSRSALTVDSGYGSTNPSCPSPRKMAVPIRSVTFRNISQAAGTGCDYMLDFKGLDGSAIEGVSVEGVVCGSVGEG